MVTTQTVEDSLSLQRKTKTFRRAGCSYQSRNVRVINLGLKILDKLNIYYVRTFNQ